jgi:hypothetical protein
MRTSNVLAKPNMKGNDQIEFTPNIRASRELECNAWCPLSSPWPSHPHRTAQRRFSKVCRISLAPNFPAASLNRCVDPTVHPRQSSIVQVHPSPRIPFTPPSIAAVTSDAHCPSWDLTHRLFTSIRHVGEMGPMCISWSSRMKVLFPLLWALWHTNPSASSSGLRYIRMPCYFTREMCVNLLTLARL